MENNQVNFDNTVVWRDFTAEDFEKTLKTLCNVKRPRKYCIQFSNYLFCAGSYDEAIKGWAEFVYKHTNNHEYDRNN
nr:MAG TPA: hypothetical protein [Caudoviricetes sp.]